MESVNVDVQVAATDGEPVFYVISYLVQDLLDIYGGKIIPPVNYRSLSKQNGNFHLSKLILDALRVLRIKLRCTLFKFS